MVAYDYRFSAEVRALHSFRFAQHTFNDKRKFSRFNIGTDHIRSLDIHLLTDYNIKTFCPEDVIDIHTDTECAAIFGKLHLVSYLLIIRIRFYDADRLCTGFSDTLEHIVFHHADKV